MTLPVTVCQQAGWWAGSTGSVLSQDCLRILSTSVQTHSDLNRSLPINHAAGKVGRLIRWQNYTVESDDRAADVSRGRSAPSGRGEGLDLSVDRAARHARSPHRKALEIQDFRSGRMGPRWLCRRSALPDQEMNMTTQHTSHSHRRGGSARLPEELAALRTRTEAASEPSDVRGTCA